MAVLTGNFQGPPCVAASLALALHVFPLPRGARFVFAAALGLNVSLLALSSWTSLLGLVTARVGRARPGHLPRGSVKPSLPGAKERIVRQTVR